MRRPFRDLSQISLAFVNSRFFRGPAITRSSMRFLRDSFLILFPAGQGDSFPRELVARILCSSQVRSLDCAPFFSKPNPLCAFKTGALPLVRAFPQFGKFPPAPDPFSFAPFKRIRGPSAGSPSLLDFDATHSYLEVPLLWLNART